MADAVDPSTRSRIMSAIRGRDTKPEMLVRKGLHAMGFRYRLHVPGLPSKPDIVLPRYRAAIFINGCFWHGHTHSCGGRCHLFRLPDTRREFWRQKIASNAARDAVAAEALSQAGWRHLVVWECALKGRKSLDHDQMLYQIAEWIRGDEVTGEVSGGGDRSGAHNN